MRNWSPMFFGSVPWIFCILPKIRKGAFSTGRADRFFYLIGRGGTTTSNEICPTCPKGSQYDEYRKSSSLFNYDDETGIIVNGDLEGVVVNGKRGYDINEGKGFLLGSGWLISYFGTNNIGTRGKFAGATKGTSAASLFFRGQSWGNKKTPDWLFNGLPKRIGLQSNSLSLPIRSRTVGGLLGRLVPVLGIGSTVINAGSSIYNIANSDNIGEAITIESSGWAGAYLGFKFGVYIGGIIGAPFGGIGAAPGAAIGGMIGSGIGYLAGSMAGKAIYDSTNK